MAALKRDTHDLGFLRDQVQAKVNDAVSTGMARLPCVQNWLEEAGSIVAKVDSIELEVERCRTRCCCVDLNSRRKLGKTAIRKIKDVGILRERGEFNEVAASPRRTHMTDQMQVPREVEQQISSKEALEDISQWLKQEDVGVICVWGMGGVGKTTLMKEIHNRLNETRDFQQVVWVTVSKDLDLEVIQRKIANKLGLEFHGNEGREEKRDRLYARLRNVRYMLVLDDLWQKFSLDEVGVPQPDKENRCKIVITTRLNEVSSEMEADRQIKIKPLGSKDAWNLFCSKTGDAIHSSEIRPIAEKVVEQLGGLPLAITTVGRAMRRKNGKELWQNALRALRGSAPEIRGMEREVFLSLKLSYDYLEDPTLQSCFLYCSLFPEDYDITIREAVRFWVYEGLINNVSSLDDAMNKGYDIIEKLKDVCLLEEVNRNSSVLRMHDLLRDLAIWITSSSSSCSQTVKFLVRAGEGLEQPPEEKTWEGMHRISLMHNHITELQIMPNCPDLVSLILCFNNFVNRHLTVHDRFFQFMPKLQILDLSHTSIKSLPSSFPLLVNLRVFIACSCVHLQVMPPLDDLKELQVLNLDGSGIKNLPRGIESLEKLKCLDLSSTIALARIPRHLISGLTSLEELALLNKGKTQTWYTWKEVATLPRLTSLSIGLPSIDAFTANNMKHPMWSRLSRFHILFGSGDTLYQRALERSVIILDCEDFPSQNNCNRLMENTEELVMIQCQGLESLSQIIGCGSTNIKWIRLIKVQGIKYVVDLRNVGAKNVLGRLEELSMTSLHSLQKVFDGEPSAGFHQLKRIHISCCPKLTCVFSSSMLQHLDGLETLIVDDCEEIVEIVGGGLLPDMALQRLRGLVLSRLPKLTSICWPQLVLTSVAEIIVSDCPKLKKLPVLCSGLLEIEGQVTGGREWWEGIEWEDDHSKSLYTTIYSGSREERLESLQGNNVEEASGNDAEEPAKEAGGVFGSLPYYE